MERNDGMIFTGENQRTQRKIGPSATLSTTNPTWTEPGLSGGRLVTNCLSHGTAFPRDVVSDNKTRTQKERKILNDILETQQKLKVVLQDITQQGFQRCFQQ
jgi:hypothetical protein